MNEEVIIPVTMFLVGFGIAAIAIFARYKRNQMEHQERMLALEKGTPLPEKPVVPARRSNPYGWGFVLIAFGLAMAVGLSLEGDTDWIWGGLFLFVGVAILAANLLHRRDLKKMEGENSAESPDR